MTIKVTPDEMARLLLYLLLCHLATTGQAQNEERSVTVRVVGGINEREGIVLITYDGQEGKLCDDGFDELDAAVICRMLGFTGEARPVINEQAVFGPGATSLSNYILSDLDCDGSEPTIADCKKGFWLNTECTRKDDEVGVLCLGEKLIQTTTTPRPISTTTLPPQICKQGELPSEDVRLVGGSNTAEGRVEVKRPNGTWGAICDDSWGVLDAQVICRMLCYNPANSQAHIGPEMYGNSTSPIYLDEVSCRGNETDILDCSASVGVHDCGLTEPASVSCLRNIPTPSPPPQPVLECSNDRITAKFDRNKEPDLRTTHLSLLQGIDENCGYTKTRDANFVTMSIPFVGCNTNKEKTNETHITYTNTIRHEVPPSSDVISRATVFNIEVSCIMPRDPDPELSIEPEDPVALPVDGTGDFRVNMNLFIDQTFKTILQPFPAKVTVGNWVYVGIALSSTDNSLKLVVPECWATPTNDPDADPKYYFIEQKCKVESSVFFYSLNETMFAFRFQSFKFQGNGQAFVYVHCKSYICNQGEKDTDCDRTCNAGDLTKSRDKRTVVGLLPNNINNRNKRSARKQFETDQGPLIIVDKIEGLDQEEQQKAPDLPLPGDVSKIPTGGSTGLVAAISTCLLTCFSIANALSLL